MSQHRGLIASAGVAVGFGVRWIIPSRPEYLAERKDQRERKESISKQRTELRGKYKDAIRPAMMFFEHQKEVLDSKGLDYPEYLFYDEELRKLTVGIPGGPEPRGHMYTTGEFWSSVKDLYEDGCLGKIHSAEPSSYWQRLLGVAKEDEEDFFLSRSTSWLGLGSYYRELVEPVDSFNWYYRGKHTREKGGKHYADGLNSPADEIGKRNKKRPSRYFLLQEREVASAAVSGKRVGSSLDKAREYRKLFGNDPIPTTWEGLQLLKAQKVKSEAGASRPGSTPEA